MSHNAAYGQGGYSYPRLPPPTQPYQQGGHYPYPQAPAAGGTALPPPHFQYRPPQFHIPPENPTQKKRRRWLYTYYALRQAALIVPLVIIVLNINIYVSRRGSYLNDDTDPLDPVFYSMWLTTPLSAVVAIWALVGLLCIRKSPGRGGIPYQVQFGVELLFTLAAITCFIMLVVNMADKRQNGYVYPYIRYEAPLAALLGLFMVIQFGLVARAYFEVNLERKRRERHHVTV